MHLAISYLGRVARAVVLASARRSYLERRLVGQLGRRFSNGDGSIKLYKSGRCAMGAIFAALKEEDERALVLVPDFVCNVVQRSAAIQGVTFVEYATDELSRFDPEIVLALANEHDARAIVIAPLFGAQSHSSAAVRRLREVRPEILVVYDDCQNLTTEKSYELDARSVVVLSFNHKHVPGAMGGALLCGSRVKAHEPRRRGVGEALRTDALLITMMVNDVRRVLARHGAMLLGTAPKWPSPTIEHSQCRATLYRVDGAEISRLSAARAVIELERLHALEADRFANFVKLERFLDRSGWGGVVRTENAHNAPLVALRDLRKDAIGRLPLKGAYATDGDAARSARPNWVAFVNDPVRRPWMESVDG